MTSMNDADGAAPQGSAPSAPGRRERPLPRGLSATDQPTPSIAIDLPHGRGLVARHGAQVLEWAPTDKGPVLWVSPESEFGDQAAIRGGIPLCFPWFGPGVSGDRKPAHGVARLATWRLTETGTPDGIAHLLFTLTAADLVDTAFPDALPGGAIAYLSIALDGQLRLDFTVQAGSEPVTFEAALHTYFAVGDVRQVQVSGLDGRPYLDKAAGGTDAVQSGNVTFGEEVDRVYDHTGPATIIDPVLRRTITVAKHDSANTIVWNPGAEKCAAMSDTPDDAWTAFVCVETGNVREHAITVQPRESHTMSVIYRVNLQD